ncbi:uncharacterized protein LOC131332870 [Rhododendron vialii]|uniref:uncharacterized protein LOC131332870 n=1 Tax=Rhododendron vialii TaxID=182163 RepID=UPI00265F39CC|nr:uncharacterized protein LOC131332870 [Rhododendron vialii]
MYLNSWSNPTIGNIKLNTYGCWYDSNGIGGFGGLFRNHLGDWIMRYYGKRRFNSSLEAELWSIHKGLEIILERKLENVKIESDSPIAVNLITEGNPDNHPRVLGAKHTEDLVFVTDMPIAMREFVIRDSLNIRYHPVK